MISKISRLKIYKNHKKNLFNDYKAYCDMQCGYVLHQKIGLKYIFLLMLVYVNNSMSGNNFFGNEHFSFNQPNNTHVSTINRQGLVDPSFILDLLNQIGAKNIIEQPFFLHTNGLNTRIIQDLPLFNDPRPVKRRDVVPTRTVSVTPFYTHISHAILHHKGDDLKDYLALDDKTVISALHEIFSSLNQFSDAFYFDTVKVFNALKNGSVEQRRAGMLFTCEGRLGECSITGSLPLYYIERNFQLSKKDKASLEEEFGATTKKEQEQFKKDHLIADKLGIGDMRIKVALPLTESWKEHCEIAFFTTMPLGGAFVKGIMGNSFTGSSTVPTLDIDSLFDMIIAGEQAKAFAVLNNLGLDALDRLSATLLEQNVTNARHFSLGLGLINKLKLKDFFKTKMLRRWHWNYNLCAEYSIPSKHHRSFISKIDNQIIADLDFINPKDPEKTLQIFTQEALDRFFLRSFKAKIHPGVVVRSYSTFVYKHQKWQVWLGSDFWFKSAEKVVFLDASSAIQETLDRRKVKNSYGLALSSLFGFAYTHQKEAFVIDTGVDAYATYCTRGIGQEIGFALKIVAHF